jgi:hypothetical protein
MGESYRYFDLDPGSPLGGRPLDEALAIVRSTFDHVHEDADAAVADATRRHRALANLGAPPEILALYADPNVVRIRASDNDSAECSIEFDLWDGQGVMAYPKPDETCFEACERLAQKLADALGYSLSVEECD